MNLGAEQIEQSGKIRRAATPSDRAASALCALLGDDVDVHRCAAAKALGRIGNPASVDALIAALLDEDADVRTDVATALACFGDPRSSAPLLESLLGDPCAEVKLAAIDAFGQSEYDEAVPWLRRLVRSRDEEIVWDEDEFHTGGWDDWTDLQVRAINVLATTGVLEAVGDIVAAIDDEDGQDLTEIGFKALARLGEGGKVALTGYLEHGNERYRRRAAAALAEIDGEPPQDSSGQEATAVSEVEPATGEVSLDAAIERLSDLEQPLDLRLAAIDELAKLGGKEVVQPLASIIGDKERPIRLAAISTLIALAVSENAWPNEPANVLLAALRGELVPAPEPEEVVEAEEQAAGEEEDAEAAEDEVVEPVVPTSTLQAILQDEPAAIRNFAEPEEGIELTRDDMERLALAVRRPRKRAIPVIPDVAPYLDVRRFAARVLGDLARIEVAGELAIALGQDDGEVQRAAADSLARIGEQMNMLPVEAIDALRAALGSTDRELRISAVRGLGVSGQAEIAKTLNLCLGDGDEFIRAEAVRSLSHLGVVGDKVEAMLEDPEPRVRLAVAQAMACKPGPKTFERLIDFTFANEGYHHRQVARLLRDMDAGEASARFVSVFDDPAKKRVWRVAIECLEEIHSSDLN